MKNLISTIGIIGICLCGIDNLDAIPCQNQNTGTQEQPFYYPIVVDDGSTELTDNLQEEIERVLPEIIQLSVENAPENIIIRNNVNFVLIRLSNLIEYINERANREGVRRQSHSEAGSRTSSMAM